MPLPPAVSRTAGRALRALATSGPTTRPELAERLGVTKQTASAAIAELEDRRLVQAVSAHQGPVGRSALRYGLHAGAGWVAGVDLGSSRLRVAAGRLDGTVVAERLVPNPAPTVGRDWPDQLEVAAHALAGIAQELSEAEGGLLGAGIATARPVVAVQDLLDDVEPADARLLAALAPVAPAAVWAENDVNCEAVAQLRYRAGPVPPVVLHLHVGAGVGAAVIVDGRVLRGARGRAGQIEGLAVPGGTVERVLSVGGLLAAAGHSRTAPLPQALDDLFSAAAAGDAAADGAIAAEAEGLADLLAQLTAVVDPDLVVLSGEAGERPALRSRVAAACEARGLELAIAPDPLGDGAAVLGAVALAADRVLSALAPH